MMTKVEPATYSNGLHTYVPSTDDGFSYVRVVHL